ncbi:MAG: hypothetical protein SFV18_13815 [Bryobacteraceae bacterium]|nr:hypothetical protein [Bryobacteraceae bacterium]
MARVWAVALALSVSVFAVCAVACDSTPPSVSHCHHEEDSPKLCKDVVSVVEYAAFDLPMDEGPIAAERAVDVLERQLPAVPSTSPPPIAPLRL